MQIDEFVKLHISHRSACGQATHGDGSCGLLNNPGEPSLWVRRNRMLQDLLADSQISRSCNILLRKTRRTTEGCEQ